MSGIQGLTSIDGAGNITLIDTSMVFKKKKKIAPWQQTKNRLNERRREHRFIYARDICDAMAFITLDPDSELGNGSINVQPMKMETVVVDSPIIVETNYAILQQPDITEEIFSSMPAKNRSIYHDAAQHIEQDIVPVSSEKLEEIVTKMEEEKKITAEEIVAVVSSSVQRFEMEDHSEIPTVEIVQQLIRRERFYFGPYLPFFDQVLVMVENNLKVKDNVELELMLRMSTIRNWFGPIFNAQLERQPVSMSLVQYEYPEAMEPFFSMVHDWVRVHVRVDVNKGVLPVPYHNNDAYCYFCCGIYSKTSIDAHIMECCLMFAKKARVDTAFIDDYYSGVTTTEFGLEKVDLRVHRKVAFVNPFFTWLYAPWVTSMKLTFSKLIRHFGFDHELTDFKPDICVDGTSIHFPCAYCDNTAKQVLPYVGYYKLPRSLLDRDWCVHCGIYVGFKISYKNFLAVMNDPKHLIGPDGQNRIERTHRKRKNDKFFMKHYVNIGSHQSERMKEVCSVHLDPLKIIHEKAQKNWKYLITFDSFTNYNDEVEIQLKISVDRNGTQHQRIVNCGLSVLDYMVN